MGMGYIGTPLVPMLQLAGHLTCVTTTQESRALQLQEQGYEAIWLSNPYCVELKEAIDRSDGLIILIAPKKPELYEATYKGTAEALFSMLHDRKRPFHLIYTSSTQVYEGHQPHVVDEKTPLHPQSDKALCLLQAEHLYQKLPVDTCIFRLAGIYGPDRSLRARADYFCGQTVPGTGNEWTNHIHQQDILKAILFSINHRLCGTYNLVCDDHPTRQELYGHLCQSMNLQEPIWNPSLPLTRGGGYWVSNEKIKEAGYHFIHPKLEIHE